jgi:hypothetical protein
MYRIDNVTAALALPTPAAVGPKPNGYFTKGDPVGGVPATVVDDDWANAIQEEIVAVILAAGLTLNKTNAAQLLAALRAAGVFQTQAQGDNTTKAATTAHVQAAIIGGAGQSWQDLSASRAVSTVYTNSTGRPIAIRCGCTPSGATGFYTIAVDSVEVARSNAAAGIAFSLYAIVPAGSTYQMAKGGADTTTTLAWSELRS